MKIDVVTLFPEAFTSLGTGLVGRALERGDARVEYIDPRDFTSDVHRTVDGPPFGGGGGMVLRVEPLAAAICEARRRGAGPVLLMTPQGRPLRQPDLVSWSRFDHLIVVCGRYEGFDERIRGLCDAEVSVGDFVLTGGEPGALCLLDGVIRLLPGTLGNAASPEQDSFSVGLGGLLEHPQYTRPVEWEGQSVPDVLRSGDHAAVARWRRREALMRTRERRPDLLAEAALDADDLAALQAPAEPSGRAIWYAPSQWEDGALETLLRLGAAYGAEKIFVTPDASGPDALERRLQACPPLMVQRFAPRRRDRSILQYGLSDRGEVAGPGEVEAWLGAAGVGAACRGVQEAGPRKAALGPEGLVNRPRLREAPRWVLGAGSGIPGNWPSLPPLRGGQPGGTGLEPLWRLGLQLDRLVGEG